MSTALRSEITDNALAQAKPPFLRRVRIRGYKSIAFCDVTLEPLTILVGRNASGKSNFLDALAFLRDALEDGPNTALEAHGGISVFCLEPRTNRLMFEIDSEFPSYRMICRATYRVELALSARKQLEVEQEYLKVDDVTNGRTCSFTAARGRVSWQGLESFQEGGYRRVSPEEHPGQESDGTGYPALFAPYRADRLLLGVIGSQPFIDLADGMRSAGLFSFHPESIREPQPSVGSPALKRDGRNLARAIEGLKEIEEDDVARVAAYLRAIVPGVEDFEVVPVADRETIKFRVRSKAEGPPLELYASSMSDGTLRALAALVAAFQIALPHGYPSLVAIEEPETALHPAAIRALVDALDEATLRTQILLTTHNADMLDNPTIKPENLRIVQLVEGKTVIGPIDEASVEIVARHLSTLGGLERENQLEPDLDDQERQRHLFQNGAEPQG
jgi:predicted ATPase